MSQIEVDRSAMSYLPTEVQYITWSIKKFSAAYSIAKSSETKTFAKLEFEAGDSIGIPSKWEFFCNQLAEEDVELSLRFLSSSNVKVTEIAADYSVSLQTNGGFFKETHSSASNPDLYKLGGCSYGWKNFGTISGLRRDGYFWNDEALTLKFKFTLFGKQNPILLENSTRANWELIFSKEISSDLGKLMEDESNADVNISVINNDGKKETIKAHKLILSMRSPVLAAMFSNGMTESTSGLLEIEDMGVTAVKVMLKYIYTGTLDEDWVSVVEELINAAEKYQLELLKKYIDENIQIALTNDNALRIMTKAKFFKMETALNTVKKYIKNNLEGVLEAYEEPS